MFTHYDPATPLFQHQHVLSNLRRQRFESALRRQARAQRLRRRADSLERLAQQAVRNTVT